MKYQVPQFLEVEDKIVGPLSIKQFLYLAGGIGGAYLSFAWLPIYLAIFPAAIIGGLGGALAFARVNNRPFIDLLEAGFKFLSTTKLYIWKRTEKKEKPEIEISYTPTKRSVQPLPMTHAAGNSLTTLGWQIDTHDKAELQKELG